MASGIFSVTSLSAGRAVSAICQGVIILWVTSHSSQADLTFLLTWFSMALVVSGVSDFGFTTLVVMVGRDDLVAARRHYGQNLTITLAIILFAIFATGLFFILDIKNTSIPNVLIVSALLFVIWGLLESLSESGNMYQLVANKTYLASSGIASRRILALVFCLVFGNYIPMITLLPLSLIFGTSLNIAFIKVGPSLEFAEHKSLRKSLKPYAVLSLLGQIRNADVPLVSSLFPVTQASSFALSSRLASPIAILAGSVGNVLLSKRIALAPKRIIQGVAIIVLLALLILISSSALANSSLGLAQVVVHWISKHQLAIVYVVLARWILLSGITILFAALVSQDLTAVVTRSQMVFTSLTIASIFAFGSLGVNIDMSATALFLLSLIQAISLTFKLVKRVAKRAE